jgi:2'-5' RNA ligase
MPFALQLGVDAETNARLNTIAEKLDRISGLETVRRIGDVHHVSLGVYDDVTVERFVTELMEFAETLEAIPIRLANIGIFSGAKNVLYLGPVVTEALLALHRRFHEALSDCNEICSSYYLPGAWVPHVTLALDVEAEALKEALEVVRETSEPADARLDAIRLIRFRPIEVLYLRALPGGVR